MRTLARVLMILLAVTVVGTIGAVEHQLVDRCERGSGEAHCPLFNTVLVMQEDWEKHGVG